MPTKVTAAAKKIRAKKPMTMIMQIQTKRAINVATEFMVVYYSTLINKSGAPSGLI